MSDKPECFNSPLKDAEQKCFDCHVRDICGATIVQTEEHTCPNCNGTGEGLHDGSRCIQCKGLGELGQHSQGHYTDPPDWWLDQQMEEYERGF